MKVFAVCLVISAVYGHDHVPLPNFTQVVESIRDVMTTPNVLYSSGEQNNHYGPFFIRLAWHCTGSYRTSDGRGGCDGGNIRFPPESDWGANKHLDLAIQMLQPVKDKYEGLSWGDLIVLAGNTAIHDLGGPKINFCGGRSSSVDGSASEKLDNAEIYLPGDTFDPEKVRESFKIMDMNDKETVVLIGGGHAYGRMHSDTSGFEGPWTSTPLQFSNLFFTYLRDHFNDYIANNVIVNGTGANQTVFNGLTMLYADLALYDDPEYKKYVDFYANDTNLQALHHDFGAAWEKLTNRDLGAKNCVVNQPKAEQSINATMINEIKKQIILLAEDPSADFGNYGPFFVRLAWHCAGTFRSTDYRGGCNGARIMHDPEVNWGSNVGLTDATALLQGIKDSFDISFADLIVLTGNTVLETMRSHPIPFCGGRMDATAETSKIESKYLDPDIYNDAWSGTAEQVKESFSIMDMSIAEMTVLNGGGHSIGRSHTHISGFSGPWTRNPLVLSNDFFTTLLDNDWKVVDVPVSGKKQYVDNATQELTMFGTDLVFKTDPEFLIECEKYYADNDLFLKDFGAAWTKLVNADMEFRTECPPFSVPSTEAPVESTESSVASASPTESIATQLDATVINVILVVSIFFRRYFY